MLHLRTKSCSTFFRQSLIPTIVDFFSHSFARIEVDFQRCRYSIDAETPPASTNDRERKRSMETGTELSNKDAKGSGCSCKFKETSALTMEREARPCLEQSLEGFVRGASASWLLTCASHDPLIMNELYDSNILGLLLRTKFA